MIKWLLTALMIARLAAATSSASEPLAQPNVASPPPSSPAFLQGQADRQAWESWFSGINGSYHNGAWYWSGQRSLAHPGSCATPPPGETSDWTAGCLAAQQKLAGPDVRRKTEPDYRLGWNNPSPSFSAQASAAPSPTAPVAPRVPSTREPERAYFGHHAGESAIVISKTGVGTDHAQLQILLDWNREVWACSQEYLTYPGGPPDQKRYSDCLAYSKEHFQGPTTRTASANCVTGKILGFGATIPRFYVGRIEQTSSYGPDKGKIYYVSVLSYEGFRLPDFGYMGVWEDGEVFRTLCPTSFLGPPDITLPELVLDIDCQRELPNAIKTATAVGIGHIMNVKIIDAWDVKGGENTWYASKCSAKVTFNTGGDAILEYEQIPRHGKYFIATRIVQ